MQPKDNIKSIVCVSLNDFKKQNYLKKIHLIIAFRSTFNASRYKYILNKECIKGEEVPGSDTTDFRIS